MQAKRSLAAAQVLLLAPAILFMGALVVRSLSPLEQEPAHTANPIVMWYGVRLWTLWVLLIALPLTVLLTGVLELFRGSIHLGEPRSLRHRLAIRGDRAMQLVAGMTLTAGIFLAIVVLHMAAN
jgi:hypothetical protein